VNIFILDYDVDQCAKHHCDQHVSKMILESAQLLCTALNKQGFTTPYRSTHTQHPCTIWAGDSYDNFQWLVNLSIALNDEYRWRYNKENDHASIKVIRNIEQYRFPSKGLTPFVQAMPNQYKVPNDPVEAYRCFYRAEKSAFAKWTKRDVPDWFLPLKKCETLQT